MNKQLNDPNTRQCQTAPPYRLVLIVFSQAQCTLGTRMRTVRLWGRIPAGAGCLAPAHTVTVCQVFPHSFPRSDIGSQVIRVATAVATAAVWAAVWVWVCPSPVVSPAVSCLVI